jgi:hypothetical protein
MISGMLPNNTIWWLSTNGQKIWIESKDLELNKFKEKGYNIKRDLILHTGQAVGELTSSRLESRKRKDAWIVKVESAIDIYPELMQEIKKKEIEIKKKKKELASKNRRNSKQRIVTREVPKEQPVRSDGAKENPEEPKKSPEDEPKKSPEDEPKKSPEDEPKKIVEPKRDSFDANSPYVSWIKDEIEKSADGITISFPSIKEKMGGEFMSMHDLRIFFGLQKILSSVGIKVEQGYKAREHAIVMKKIS